MSMSADEPGWTACERRVTRRQANGFVWAAKSPGTTATNTVAWGMRARSGAGRLKCMPNGLPTLEHLAERRGSAAQPPSSRPSQEHDHEHG
jgi:hypothetical protein